MPRIARIVMPNGATTYFSYDVGGRLSEKMTKKDADASVLVRFAYTRDAAGNPLAIERESGLGTFYYQYDALQRLSYEGQFVSDTRQYENYYEYDAAGNRTLLRHGETAAENLTYYSYNAANELTDLHDKDGWTYFGYDANGNTIQEQTPTYTRYFDYDGRNMMTGARSTEGSWTNNEYRYDGLAMRAAKLDSTGFIYYDWDGINPIQEKDGAGSVMDRQVHGYAPIPSVGDITHMDKSGTVYVPIPDQPGTIWNLLDDVPAKANSYTYDAFGESRSVSETVINPYRFGTKPVDPDSNLYYFIARQYMPTMGRFLTRDLPAVAARMSLLEKLNNYQFSEARPSTMVDPSGEYDIIVALPGFRPPGAQRGDKVLPPRVVRMSGPANCYWWQVERWWSLQADNFTCKGNQLCCAELKTILIVGREAPVQRGFPRCPPDCYCRRIRGWTRPWHDSHTIWGDIIIRGFWGYGWPKCEAGFAVLYEELITIDGGVCTPRY